MPKKTEPRTKEERLAAKLRENLSRRKAQVKARKARQAGGTGSSAGGEKPRGTGER